MASAPEDEAEITAMRCAGAMWTADACARGLGVVLVEVAPGRAVVDLVLDERMANGHGTAHGGVLFTLADSAFALAANSRDRRTVAHEASIHFLKPAAIGTKLRAEATERTLSGRSGVFDVTVRDAAGEVVAEFRGLARTTGDAVLAGEDG